MPDINYPVLHGVNKKLCDMGDGTHAEVIASTGTVSQVVPDFRTPTELLEAYNNFNEVNWAGGDFVTRVSTSNGQSITALTVNPLTPGESRVVLNTPVIQPCALEVEASVIRNRQQFATLTLFSNGVDGTPSAVPDPINIVSISQSTATSGAAYTGTAGTVVTLILETALPEYPSEQAVYLSDWINITGLVDSRLNYQNACINYISPDRKTLTFGFSDEVALPSLAIPVVMPILGTAKAHFYNNLGGAAEGFGLRFTGATATSAAVVSLFGNGDAQVSGTLLGDHRITISSSNPAYVNGTWGQYELKATSRYRLEGRPLEATVLDKTVDGTGAFWSPRATRTAVKPAVHLPLYPRMRLYQPVGMSRPLAKIVSITKSGTTTATITTDVPHNLAVNNVVTLYGMRDVTNFPGGVTTVTAVPTSTTFQCVVGSAVTATSYGGMVSSCNGGAAQPGVIGQYVQSVANQAGSPDWLSVVGNTTWAGLAVGDYINLYGVRDATTGADLSLDGVWEVANLATSTLVVKPVVDVMGTRQSPVTPTLSGTVNAGGAIILRTTARVHDLVLEQWSENKVMLDGQGTLRTDKAMPVYGMGGSFGVSQGTAATVSVTTGFGGWMVHPAHVRIADIASAALTATATSAAITNSQGNGFQVTVPVTAVTGTTPTLDIRIEESFDGGTNWVTLYEFQRITAVGSYNSPILRATGANIRYVRTVGGTSPSFTHAVSRNLLPFMPSEPQKRIVDRTIVPNTANSVTPTLFQGAANNVQLVVNMGAITTTAPAFQVEGSEDGANWYAVGAPLTAVANSTVEQTVNKSCTFIRARVSTAGSGATLGYVALKAWS